MPLFNVIDSDGRIQNFPILKDEITIGRNQDNDVVLPDHSVSRNHAKLTKTKKGYMLSDLGSFNGTKVNEKLIQNALLKDNDEVRIGVIKLTFSTKEKPAKSPSDTVVLTSDRELEIGTQTIVKASPEIGHQLNAQELLMSVGIQRTLVGKKISTPLTKEAPAPEAETDILSLERMNKVLFVLFEISRQLHLIHDFNELLKKIMDLIFMVVDADYGFVILTGNGDKEDLTPVVIKYKDDKIKDKKEIQASRTIINKVVNDKVALLTSNAMDDARFDHAQSLISQQIRSAMCAPLWRKDKIIGVIQLDSIRLTNQFTEDDLELLKAIGCQIAMVIEQASLNEKIREEEQMRNRLERFHSPQVVEMILKESQEAKENIMEPKDQTVTILFTDIVGFTHLSETMPPREINMLLNQFFSQMTDIIFKYEGTLDKYIGDCLMAVFGAPLEKKGDSERAIKAALEMRKKLEEMMEKTEEERRFHIRIGINTGKVVAGNIGSPNRMEYTVIGDPVNIASRLESIAEPNQILIGDETYRDVKDKFKIKKVGLKKVKGKSEAINVYEVIE